MVDFSGAACTGARRKGDGAADAEMTGERRRRRDGLAPSRVDARTGRGQRVVARHVGGTWSLACFFGLACGVNS